MGSIMQCLCQLSWRKTVGQMVKMERKTAAKPLILVCECKLPPFWGSAQAVPLEIYRAEWDFCSMHGCSGSCTLRRFTLCTADGSWEVQPRHWSLHTYAQKNKYMYSVCHQALAELLLGASHWAVSGCTCTSSLHTPGTSHEHMDTHRQVILNLQNHCWALSLQILQQTKHTFSQGIYLRILWLYWA